MCRVVEPLSAAFVQDDNAQRPRLGDPGDHLRPLRPARLSDPHLLARHDDRLRPQSRPRRRLRPREQPIFKKISGAEGVLRVGDAFTLEPGLYDPTPGTGYGVRLEDLVWLGPEGSESLMPVPYEMDPRGW